MESNGSELPEFLTEEERSYLTVVLPVHKRFLQTWQPSVAGNKSKKRKSLPEIKKLIVKTLEQQGIVSTAELIRIMG